VFGEMAERFNAAVLKTVVGSYPPGVRIPLSPPPCFVSRTKSLLPKARSACNCGLFVLSRQN
jgi:hypothetical protein